MRHLVRRTKMRSTNYGTQGVQDTTLAWVALWSHPAAVPAVGAGVWVAFEGGNPSLPVWMGITQ